MIKKFYLFILLTQRISRRNPRLMMTVFIITTLFLALGLPQLRFLLSVDDLIDRDFKSYTPLQMVRDQFDDRNTVFMSIESPTVFDKKFICDLQVWILKLAETKSSELKAIQTTFGLRQAEIIDQNLTIKSPFELDCLSPDPETEKIEKAFQEIKKSPWIGLMHTYQGYSLTLNFVVRAPDQKYGHQNIQISDFIKSSFTENFKNTTYQTFYGGVTTYQSYLKKAMDVTQSLNMLMFIISLFIFRFFLGTWKAGFIYNITILISNVWVNGLMGYTGIPIDVLSNTTGLLLFVSCLEDFVFITYGVQKFGWSLSKSLRRFAVASFFTSLTTAIGFASLGTSDLGVIRRTGYIVAFGGMLEWMIIFLVLPALLNGRFKSFFRLKMTAKYIIPIRQIVHFDIGPKLSYAFVFISLGTLLFAGNLKVKDSPESFFHDSHDINRTSKHMLDTRGWTNENSLIFNAENSKLENKRIIDQIMTHPIVKNVESTFMVEDYIIAKIPAEDRSAVLDLWRDSEFAKRLISDDRVHRAQIFLNTMENDVIDEFISFVEKTCGDRCQIVGTIISYSEFSNRVLMTLFNSFSTSLFLIMLVIFLIRKPLGLKEVFACVISSLWGPITLLGIFIWFQLPVFFISSICASVLVGIAGDNAIQFIFNAKKQKLTSSLEALSEASFIITFGYCLLLSVFFLSPIAPIAKLGVLMILGIFLCYFGDLYILKGLLHKKK